MLNKLEDYDWQEAFGYAGEPETNGYPNIKGALPTGGYDLTPFTREDVAEICGIREGENDGEQWMIYGRLRDNRWFYLEAGCDYTGWDCQASGSAIIAKSREEIERFGLGDDARYIFGVKLASAFPDM